MTTEKAPVMTVAEFLAMHPREQDAFTEENLFGRFILRKRERVADSFYDSDGYAQNMPHHSTDHNTIWAKVDRMKALGWDVFGLLVKYDIWECRFGKVGTIYGTATLQDTPALAVTVCALKAIGAITEGGD